MILNLIDRVKHSFSKDKEFSSSLQSILGFYPHNIEIYRIALTHKSKSYRGQNGRSLNNERLEFLGDAILEAVVSDIVFHRYERKREGFLSSTRSKIVQRASLNRLATDLGLGRLVKVASSAEHRNSNIGGNAFEAFMGAIYLDRGYRYCKWFIEKRVIGRLLDIDSVAQKEVNFKSKLLEWTQKNRIQAEYTFKELDGGEDNCLTFYSEIVIEGLTAGSGKGLSKRESQQAASRDALTRLRQDSKLSDAIYRSKEKRTAMEADEICALPKIDEIEEDIAKQAKRPSVSRNAKRSPRRPTESSSEDKPATRQPRDGQKKEQANRERQKPSGNTPKGNAEKQNNKAQSTPDKPSNATGRNRQVKSSEAQPLINGNPSAEDNNAAGVSAVTEVPRPSLRRLPRNGQQKGNSIKSEVENSQTDEQTNRQRRPLSTRLATSQQNEKEREAIIRQAEETAFNGNI